jgi:hypothetical protein
MKAIELYQNLIALSDNKIPEDIEPFKRKMLVASFNFAGNLRIDDSTLIDFCRNCISGSYELIGGFDLSNDVKETEEFYNIGSKELFLICIDKKTGIVQLVDTYLEDNVLPLAESSEHFMDVIWLLALRFYDALLDNELATWCEFYKQLISKAGSVYDSSIYRSITNCYE